MCVKVPWRMSCGCDEPLRSTIVKCPVALNKAIEHCEGLETSCSILGDVSCKKCAALVAASSVSSVADIQALEEAALEGTKVHRVPTIPTISNVLVDSFPSEVPEPSVNDILASSKEGLCLIKPDNTLAFPNYATKSEKEWAEYEAIFASDLNIGGNTHTTAAPTNVEGITFLSNDESAKILATPPSEIKDSDRIKPLRFNRPPREVNDATEKIILGEAVEKIVDFVEETRNVENTHHDKHTGQSLKHGDSVAFEGVVALDEDTSAEVKIKVIKD